MSGNYMRVMIIFNYWRHQLQLRLRVVVVAGGGWSGIVKLTTHTHTEIIAKKGRKIINAYFLYVWGQLRQSAIYTHFQFYCKTTKKLKLKANTLTQTRTHADAVTHTHPDELEIRWQKQTAKRAMWTTNVKLESNKAQWSESAIYNKWNIVNIYGIN